MHIPHSLVYTSKRRPSTRNKTTESHLPMDRRRTSCLTRCARVGRATDRSGQNDAPNLHYFLRTVDATHMTVVSRVRDSLSI